MITKPMGMTPNSETIGLNGSSSEVRNLFESDDIKEGYCVVCDKTEETKGWGNYNLGDLCLNSDYDLSGYIPVVPGNTYLVIGGYYRSSSKKAIYISITWYDSNKEYIGYTKRDINEFKTQVVKAPYATDEIKGGETIGEDKIIFGADAAFMRIGLESGFSAEVWGNRNTSNDIELSVHLQTGSEVEMIDENNSTCYANLVLWTGDVYYNFRFGKNQNEEYAPIIINEEDSMIVKLTLPTGSQSLSLLGDYLYKTSYGSMEKGTKTLGQLLRNGRTISWKLRLYEKGSIINDDTTTYIPDEKIGYGVISEISNVWNCPESEDDTRIETGRRLTIFPHQNIYDEVTDGEKNSNTINMLYDIYKNIDKNIHYWVIADGFQIPISKYRLYPYTYTGGYEPEESFKLSEHFDSYGNPINGYAVCLKSDYESEDIIDADIDGLQNETYEIRTNYIDSQWAYFQIYDDAEIKVTDNIGREIKEGEIYSNTFSTLKLDISFKQKQGIGLNYYSFKVYSYDKDGETWIHDYYSGNFYNQIPIVSYDRFFTKVLYKIVINMTDINQRTYSKCFYFSTDFPDTDSNLIVDVSYYKSHHSVIVDWSQVNSINPSSGINSGDCKYYIITDNESNYVYEETTGMDTDYDESGDGSLMDKIEKASLYIPNGTSLSYTENDLHKPLNFKNSAVIVDFYGTNLTGGDKSYELFSISTSDGFNASVTYYNNNRLCVWMTNYCYNFWLYGDYSTSDIESQLADENESDSPSTAPYIWDDDLTWNDSYTWRERNNILGKWRLIITPTDCELIPLSSYNSIYKKNKGYTGYTGFSKKYTSELTLHGDVIYDGVTIINNVDKNEIFKTYGEDSKDHDLEWDKNTQFLCNFNRHVNGANVKTTLQNLVGYRVYKKLGDKDKLYEIANINADNSCILEDFAVGDNCKYTYYIYPIINTIINNGGKEYSVETISTPIISEPIMFNDGIDKILGLKEIGHRVYEVVSDEVWRIYLNLEDNGYTLKTDKTFYDSFNQYNQETIGNRKYITKTISGLIGYIDCSSDDSYKDTYDMLISWNDFCSSSNMKCLIDARGLILPGNFETDTSIEYMKAPGSPATAQFNWRQKSDLDIIKIYGSLLPLNPTKGTYLLTTEEQVVGAKDSKILYTTETREE